MDKTFYQMLAVLARKNQIYMSTILEEYDITTAELPFFLTLNDREGLTQEELTAIVCVDKAATARAIKSLEEKGYLIREKDVQDSRQNRVYPTSDAKLLKEKVKSEILEFNNQLTKGIDTQILELLYDGLQQMEKNIIGITSGTGFTEKMNDFAVGRRFGMEEWPMKIWNVKEIPIAFREPVLKWMEKDFSEYEFVYVPRQQAKADSRAYLFGYGDNKILYLKERVERGGRKETEKKQIEKIEFERKNVKEIMTSKELLLAKMVLFIEDGNEQSMLEFPYNAATYFLYNPFLNWILGLSKDFSLAMVEGRNPRPASLYGESEIMYNYALDAYRLGDGFQNYTYKVEVHDCKGGEAGRMQKEWLKIYMERGEFEVYRFGYLTECRYRINKY